MRCPCLCLCWVWDRDYVSQLPCVRYYVFVKSSNILVRNASPRGPMCFRCLIFSLSGPCELLFLLCFIASWTWSTDLYGRQCVSIRVLSVSSRHLWVLSMVCWWRVVCDVCVHGVVVWWRRVSWWKLCVCYCDVFSLALCVFWSVVVLCCVCWWPWVCLCLWKVCRPWSVWWAPPPCLCALSVRMVV